MFLKLYIFFFFFILSLCLFFRFGQRGFPPLISRSVRSGVNRVFVNSSFFYRNVVATVSLGSDLDLKSIAMKTRNSEYNPKRFAAVIMRIRKPKTTALVFSSGKMVCTGAKSEYESMVAARKYCKLIKKLGYPTKFDNFEIQNIVGSCDVKFPIHLEALADEHADYSSVCIGVLVSYTPALVFLWVWWSRSLSSHRL